MIETPLKHQPVLLREAIEHLSINADGIYVDATFGQGGHSQAILSHLSQHGRLYAMDQCPAAIQCAQARFSDEQRFSITHGSFTKLKELATRHQLHGRINGILFDLGISSVQLDTSTRGFSFQNDGPLDMRMDPSCGRPAHRWINSAPFAELKYVIKTFGEEQHAARIARAIVAERCKAPLNSTGKLAALICDVVPKSRNQQKKKTRHPATKTFQAIRVYVNQELDALASALSQCLDCLAPGAKMVVISFHSLEDRIVKRFFRAKARDDRFPLTLPVPQEQLCPRISNLTSAIRPSSQEILQNPRARSAILRAAQVLA